MTLRDALIEALTEQGLRGRDTPPEQLYADDWFRVNVGPRRLRIMRLGPMLDAVALHDAHHLITGYGTDWRGEAEIAAGELASGGCGSRWLMWIDRIFAIPLMLLAPTRSLAAAKRGRRCRNLYRLPTEEALGLDLEEAKRRVEPRPA